MMNMGRNFWLGFGATIAGLVVLAIVLTSFERPGANTSQIGFRGTSMGQVENPRTVAAALPLHAVPAPLDPADPPETDDDKASAVYQNVQVLGDLSVAQFNRIMVAMTAWVSPEETTPNGGCAYCHNVENMASDEVYTKHVARRMLQMTRRINVEWNSHVGQVGVTCYTCHRGQPVPNNVWATAPVQGRAEGLLETATGQNHPAPAAGLASLPYDPFAPFLQGEQQIRVNGVLPLPHGNNSSIKQAEWTYSLMMHMSTGLGVNCTFCHNSRAFAEWEQSPPQRTTAWHGIRMLRDVNANYIEPLREHFPPHRLGPLGDPLKANCATCHQGVSRPLYGAPMLNDYPELNQVRDGPAGSAAVTR
jgi:photosynthetic reaction center cytochrome c subunit